MMQFSCTNGFLNVSLCAFNTLFENDYFETDVNLIWCTYQVVIQNYNFFIIFDKVEPLLHVEKGFIKFSKKSTMR